MWKRAMDLFLGRTAAVKLAEVEKLFAENIEAHARSVVSSRKVKVASDASSERLKVIRSEIEQITEKEKRTFSEPRTGDVLRLARTALERVQKH